MTDQKTDRQTETLDGFTVIGITTRTTNKDNKATDDINALWQRFFDEAVGDRIPNRQGEAIYAIYHDYEGDHNAPYSLTIGCKASLPKSENPNGGTLDSSLPEGLDSVFVERGDYMVFAARGAQPKALLDTWQGIWKMDIKRAFRTDIEIYGRRFFEPDLHEILVCVGVDSQT